MRTLITIAIGLALGGCETYEHHFIHEGEEIVCFATKRECAEVAERCRTGQQKCPPTVIGEQ